MLNIDEVKLDGTHMHFLSDQSDRRALWLISLCLLLYLIWPGQVVRVQCTAVGGAQSLVLSCW
jgi:hypothetical protein